MTAPTWLKLLLAAFLVLAVFGCGSDSSDDDDDHASDDDATDDDDDNDDDDDDVADDDDDDDNDDDTTPPPGDWNGVTVDDVQAPDQYSVEVTLSANPGAAAVAETSIYTITSAHGALAVEAATLAKDATVVLTTDKQKLGVTYSLTITPLDYTGAALTGDFLAADTAQFWAYDFATGDQYLADTYRAGVGEKCVIYIEDGQTADDVADTIALFDDEIFPIETDVYYPAPDVDGNGRVLILGLDGGEFYGGYFSGVNQLPNEQTMGWWGLHSNEADMIHINVVWQTLMAVNVVTHEFQHLLYDARHGMQSEYWEYHDEGLAETAVHAVFGANQGAIDSFLYDGDRQIAEGLSLVHWQYANYYNYVQAYLWWIYLAGQLGSLDYISDIFDLDTGNPDEVDGYINDQLGDSMVDMVLHAELAQWMQEPSGPYGFGGLLSFAAGTAPTAPAGTTSVDLEPFGGALFVLAEDSVSYPGTQGANIVYVGVNGDGTVDYDEPFDVADGVLLTFNQSDQHNHFPAEHAGPDLPAQAGATTAKGVPINPQWLDPPPINPYRMDRLAAWRYRTLERIRREK